MSTITELFAPEFLEGKPLDSAAEARMADELGADSLRYLPIESVARAIGFDAAQLCRACITGEYPTAGGCKLAEIAQANHRNRIAGRTYEAVGSER